MPQVVSPHAGAANELVIDGVNGLVRPLRLAPWVEAASRLLEDAGRWNDMSGQARRSVDAYTYEAAAAGLRDAILRAAAAGQAGRRRSARARFRTHHAL